MGKIQQQGVRNAVINYFGAGLGMVNKMILLPVFLESEEVGLANIMLIIATFFAQVSSLGFINATLRFFPFFRSKPQGHHGFLPFSLAYVVAGFLLATFGFILFQEEILGYYAQKSPLLVDYYFYLIPFGLAILLFRICEAYLRSLFKTVVPLLTLDVGVRLGMMVMIFGYILELYDFRNFIRLYIGVYGLAALGLFIYMLFLKQLFLKPRITFRIKKLARRIMTFASFSFVSNVSAMLITTVDSMMLGSMLGLTEVAVYTTSVYITNMIAMPSKGVLNIAKPFVAEFWKNRDLEGINSLYKRVSLVNLSVGLLVYLGVWICLDGFYAIAQPEYATGRYVVFFLGLMKLVDTGTGLNGTILLTSQKYKWDLVFVILLVGVVIGTNLWLIPKFGIVGAALATLGSMALYNLTKVLFVWFAFKMQPFQWRLLILIAFAGSMMIGFEFMPHLDNPFLDIIVRAIIATAVYGSFIYFTRITPDLRNFADKMIGVVMKKVKG